LKPFQMANYTSFRSIFKKSLISVFLFFIISFHSIAQNTEKVLISTEARNSSFEFQNPFNAIVFRGEKSSLEALIVVANSDSLTLSIDEHIEVVDAVYQSNLLFFDNEVISLELNNVLPHKPLEMILIRVPAIEIHSEIKSYFMNCEEPPVVLQEIWRAGLPIPVYDRIRTAVKNIILHHSATSNSITNYTDLVRSIYTAHTQINGYSDIGYNYLIAPDGTIFAGRDPGLLIEQDEVLGAHFCASNTGTMGICLLGTFMTTTPTDEAKASLIQLLAWKTAKDSLSPFGSDTHPLNPNLGIIAGHRDGCATLCPGDAFYSQLHLMRENCNHELENCGVFLSLGEDDFLEDISIFPNPSNQELIFVRLPNSIININETLHLELFDIQGMKILEQNFTPSDRLISITAPKNEGVYLIHLKYKDKRRVLKYLGLK
jgi:hypothetical protein